MHGMPARLGLRVVLLMSAKGIGTVLLGAAGVLGATGEDGGGAAAKAARPVAAARAPGAAPPRDTVTGSERNGHE
jgi:hypothetical protein